MANFSNKLNCVAMVPRNDENGNPKKLEKTRKQEEPKQQLNIDVFSFYRLNRIDYSSVCV